MMGSGNELPSVSKKDLNGVGLMSKHLWVKTTNMSYFRGGESVLMNFEFLTFLCTDK